MVLLVPALLIWRLFTPVGGARQSGSAPLLQECDARRSAQPTAISAARQAPADALPQRH